jgi:hypothetical protein
MKRALFALAFLSLPILAVAGLPRADDVQSPGATFVSDTVNPHLFNAIERQVSLELSCRPDCLPATSGTGAH